MRPVPHRRSPVGQRCLHSVRSSLSSLLLLARQIAAHGVEFQLCLIALIGQRRTKFPIPVSHNYYFLFGGPFFGLATLRCLAQLLTRFKRGCKSSMASIYLHGLPLPTDRAQVTPPLPGRPVYVVGGRVAGPRATRISLRARRS